MSFTPSHRSSASLSANQAPPARAPSPFANKLRNNPPSSLLPAIPPPAPLGLPDMEAISLSSNRSKPTPIPPRRSASPLRTQAFDRSMDPEFDDDEEAPWGERPLPRPMGSSPASGPPAVTRFANTFANRMNSLFNSDAQLNGSASGQRLTDAELEAEAERAREQSRREAERILTEEAEARRRAEEQELAQRAQRKAQIEQQQRVMERAQLGRPTTPTRGMSLSPVASPKREKEGETSWWGMAKSKLTPTKEKEKEMTPAQQVIAEARGKEKEKGKKSTGGSADWPALPHPGVRSTDPTLLAMAAASRLAASPRDDSSSFLAGGLSSSPEQPRTYSPKPIMPHEQLAREIEAQGGGRVSGDLFGTRLSNDGGLTSSPKTPGPSLPFANRATPSPAPSPLQPARAQTSPAQIGLTNLGTPLMGRSPNTSPDKSPNAEKDKKLGPSDTEKERDRRAMTTSTTATTDDGAPPLYAQFTPAGALDIPLTLLTIARRFEKLEKWTVGHVRALEERMKDVERYLVEKDTKTDTVTKEIGLLKAGIQDVRRSMESLRESIPPPAPAQPPQPAPPSQPAPTPQTINLNPPTTPVRPRQDQSAANRARAMSSTSASSYATALSALNGDTSNAAAVRMSVISLGSVEADGIETRPSVAEVVTPLASRQPLPPVPSMTNSLTASNSSLGSPPSSSSRRFSSPSGSSSREFKPVPGAAKEFSPPPPMARVPSLTGSQPTSPPSALRSRLPYPSGDYTSNGQAVTPLAAAASAFPMPPGASSSSITLSGTAPLNIKSSETDKDKEEPVDKATPLALPSTRALRPEPVSPTPRKRYTVALSGGEERPHSMPTQTATFTSSPVLGSDASQLRSPPSAGRARSHSSFGAPQPPPSPTPTTSSRLRRTVSSSNDGSGGLAAVFAQTEDWEDVREKVISPRLANGGGEAKFVDPLVIRRKGAGGGNGNGNKPLPGAGRGKVPISQLVKFFDGDNK